MNAAHLHLLSNHLPVLGTPFGLALLVYALGRKSEELKRVSLGVLALVTLLAMPGYFTGEPAVDIVRNLPGVSKAIMERHEEAAQIALTAQTVLGVGALAGLIAFRRRPAIPGWLTHSAVLAALVVSGLMAWTANLGGQVRHTEIRANYHPQPNPPE